MISRSWRCIGRKIRMPSKNQTASTAHTVFPLPTISCTADKTPRSVSTTPGSAHGTQFPRKDPQDCKCSWPKSHATSPSTVSAPAALCGGGEIDLVLDELAECIAGESDVEDEYEARELSRCIQAFVRKLPVRDGNVFLRRYFFTEPVAEIARRYGLTENHVMVILSRTRKKLKAYLRKEGFFHE